MTIDEKSILRELPDGVVVLSGGKVRWANDAAHRLFRDRTREEIEFIDLIAPEDVDHFSQALTRWAEGRLLRESVRTLVRGNEGGQDRLIELPAGDEPRNQVNGWITEDTARELISMTGLDLDELREDAYWLGQWFGQREEPDSDKS